MPILVRPGSDEARITTLSKISSSHKKDSELGKGLITEELILSMDEVVVSYRQVMSDVTDLKHTRTKEISEKNEALLTLSYYVRHFWTGLKNRVIREKQSETLLTLYGLPLSGILPKTSISPQLLETAKALILSDEMAVEKGYRPMSNPSAKEIQKAHDEALAELGDTENVDKELNEVEARLAELRNSADTFIGEAIEELQFFLRKESESDLRRIMRNYGFSFKSDNSTASSEEIVAE